MYTTNKNLSVLIELRHRDLLLIMGKHSEWRKIAKKLRRKRIRQAVATKRTQIENEEFRRLQSLPSYESLLAEKINLDRLKKLEEQRIHDEQEREWLKREVEAQKEFAERQQKIALAREERAKQNEKIKREWEAEQHKLAELKKKHEEELQEKIKQQEILDTKVNEFLEFGGDTPDHLKTLSETNPNKSVCQFFNKTGACRFFDVCSRNHVRPGISKILLIPNFFSHYSLEKTENEHFTDSNLEFEHKEINEAYREFYKDVMPEIKQFGKPRIFITCCNHEAHLRGNVLIEFRTTQSALKCYRGLNGRWYGGKQLSVQFVNISSWKSAVCGVFYVNRCPKGSSCNFLHTFRNPGNSYNVCDIIKKTSESSKRNHTSESTNWRWSESPESYSKDETKEWEIDSPNRKRASTFRNGKRERSKSRDRSRRSRSSKRESSRKRRRSRSSTKSKSKNH